MASDSSFDIVSKVDRQEVDNALNQAAREVGQRFDFKGTEASIKWSGDAIAMQANGEERVKAIWDVFQTKLVRRGVDLKSVHATEPRLSGKTWHMTADMQNGISQENAKKIGKLIRDEGPKGVKAQIQGDELRVSSKKRDDLQAVQRLIREADYDFAVQSPTTVKPVARANRPAGRAQVRRPKTIATDRTAKTSPRSRSPECRRRGSGRASGHHW